MTRNGFTRGFDVDAAHTHISKRDRKFATWLKKIEPIQADPRWRKPFDPVDALARAILFQQLSGKAASTIVGRVEAAIGSNRLHADTLSRIDDAALRGCGVSGNKMLALRDLSLRESRGEIPDVAAMRQLSNEEIIAALTSIRGIGRWTVEMMLIFRLGRPDVLPIDDLGVRKGAALVDKAIDIPTPKVLAARGEAWAPFRSYAAMALWRIADLASNAKEMVKRSQE
ncbi:MAG: DNA-3-methyladenine glycosylase 2 family protein [Lysobacteraceae bacterium]